MKVIVLILASLLGTSLLANEGLTLVAVGDAELERYPIAVVNNSKRSGQDKLVAKIQEIIEKDFSFYRKKFEVKKVKNSDSHLSFSRRSDVRFGIHLNVEKAAGREVLSFGLGDYQKGELLEKGAMEYQGSDLRVFAHRIADRFFQKITGLKSVFNSKIYFVSDLGSTRKVVIKELYVMDYDGENRKKLTHHRGVALSPAVSYSGNKVMYSLIPGGINKKKNVMLRILDIKSGTDEVLSDRSGINSGAIFLPGDAHIILTLSHVGNAELYKMNLATKEVERLTDHFAPDVDPSVNNNGTLMTFLSGRPGQPMIYSIIPSGTENETKRLGFVGMFNATPRFSPDGKEIAFSSWLDNRFDLFRLNTDGSGLSRLTKDFGSNEDPTYSNDGEFIAFSSQRVLSRHKAVHNIYVMDRDGEIIENLTNGFGNCITPRWTK